MSKILTTQCGPCARLEKVDAYTWRTPRPSECAQENARLKVVIQAAHVRKGRREGFHPLVLIGQEAWRTRVIDMCHAMRAKCLAVLWS